EARPELVDRLLAHRLEAPPDLNGWQAQAAAGATFDVLDRLGEIRAPTLVIHGSEDNVVDYRNAELLAERIPGARLELIPGTGHSPEHVAVLFACAAEGLILAPLSWRLAPAEIAYQLEDSEPALFLVDEENTELAAAAGHAFDRLERPGRRDSPVDKAAADVS